MVDFLNPDEPFIKVNTWQPERKPDLTPDLPKDSPYNGIFSNGYFGQTLTSGLYYPGTFIFRINFKKGF
ncbi:MAG: hypothetical protein K2K45_11705 [Muribaculaceae bacterium]|nr:hypothetical protein [Muribaculaceae bacterium]